MEVAVEKKIVGFDNYEMVFGKSDVILSIDKSHGTQYSNFFICGNKLKVMGDLDNLEISIDGEKFSELNKYKSIIICEINDNKIKAQEVFCK